MKALVVSKRVKWWTSVAALLKPWGLTVKIYNPNLGLEEGKLLSTLLKELGCREGGFIVCEVLPLYRQMPQAATLPATVETSHAFVSFILEVFKSLREGKPFPTLCLYLPEEIGKEVEAQVTSWGFNVVPPEAAGENTFYLVGVRGVQSVPSLRSILIPNEGACYTFLSLLRELLYSYIPFDVFEEKKQEEIELGRKELQQKLERRRRKK